MSLEGKYNLKSPGVKRLMREACELAEPTEEYYATPLEDNLFEWHFTVRGPTGTEFEGGFYHGRILLPSQYPMQPPNIILLTPNGRFEINKKICLSISGHHPESWQPSWSIRTALLALIAFMPTPPAGTIGSLDYTKEERQKLARKSKFWECSICGRISDKLSSASSTNQTLTKEESSLIKQIALKAEDDTSKKSDGEIADNNDKNETSTAPMVRHRKPSTCTNLQNETEHQPVTSELLEASIANNNSDKMWSAVVWILISLITLLVIRRFFFL